MPGEIRATFPAAAIGGFITALVGSFLAEGLSDHSHQTAGVVSLLVFAAATVTQAVAGQLPARRTALADSRWRLWV